MTEKEAIERLKYDLAMITFNPMTGDETPLWLLAEDEQGSYNAYECAIKALEEIQQYRAIGTVGDCKNAMQKQQIVKPEFLHMLNDTRYKEKGKWGRVITADIDFRDNPKFCSECGAEFEWSDEE